MWKLAVSQIRSHPRRYVAVLLAITLGTMFLAAALLVTSSAKETTKQMLGATYANADLLINAQDQSYISPDSEFYTQVGGLTEPGELSDLAGVTEVYPLVQVAAGLVLPEDATVRGNLDADADFLMVTNLPEDLSLLSTPVTAGSLPGTAQEIALDTSAAERHGLTVGDTVTLRGMMVEGDFDFTVSGLLNTTGDPTSMATFTGYLAPEALSDLAGDDPMFGTALVRTTGDPTQVLEHMTGALDGVATVNTPDVEIAESMVDTFGFDAISIVLGGFAAIALLVMMLVINNTFSVLVAQRTRQYALQRVLGATRGQLRKAVLAETLLIGLIGSVLGVLAASGLIAGLLSLARRWVPRATFAFDSAIGWVILAGVLITVVAAWLPAAHAMRVSPLAAMRPVPDVTAASKSGVWRMVLGGLAFAAGSTIMIVFALRGAVGFAILGGALSFIGALLLTTLFVPATVYGLGWLIRGTGVPGKMAQLNAVRNRSRTAATATALIIGTTLVALMLTGGRTVQHNIDQMLATSFPVDISARLSDIDPADTAAITATTQTLAETPGISAASPLYPVGTLEEYGDPVLTGELTELTQISAGLTDDDVAALAEPGTVLVSHGYPEDTVTVTTVNGPVELDAIRSELSSVDVLVSQETADQLALDPAGQAVIWLQVTDPEMSTTDLQDLMTTLASNAQISVADLESPLMMRATFQQVIETVLLTVIGLLGISVLIAFVGVANTLSLSALERTRENSLLRALGLTKRGLRAMLSWEAVLICAVGALLGCVLGLFYGWAGSVAILTPMLDGQPVPIAWPWAALAGIVGVAVLAGLIASVAPAGRAAKLSPVRGLAVE